MKLAKFGEVVTIIQYTGIVRTIPYIWKMHLRHRDPGERALTGLELVPTGWKLSKYAYWETIDSKYKSNEKGVRMTWETELRVKLDNWNKIIMSPWSLTPDTKLRFFQYRCINRRLLTNSKRSKWADISDRCSFCNNAKETVIHLLWECPKVARKCNALMVWLTNLAKADIKWTLPEMLFCSYEGLHSKIINCKILIFRQYIYAQKCLKQGISFVEALSKVMSFRQVEREIAYNDKKVTKLLKKWSLLTDV